MIQAFLVHVRVHDPGCPVFGIALHVDDIPTQCNLTTRALAADHKTNDLTSPVKDDACDRTNLLAFIGA